MFTDMQMNLNHGFDPDGKKKNESLSLNVKLRRGNCWVVSRYDG